MNIQAEKVELIRLLNDINSETVLKKIRSILAAAKKSDETDRILSNPAMAKRLDESKKQLMEGKGIHVSLDEIWK